MRSVQDLPGVPAALASLPPSAAGLLVEFQEPAGTFVEVLVARAAAVMRQLPLIVPGRFTADPAEQAQLWKIRKGMFPSVGAVRQRGTTVIIEDVAFPVAALAPAVVDLQALFDAHGYRDAIVFGHAKDGNLHFVLTQSFGEPAQVARYERFMADVVTLVVTRYDGSLKGEHGTGRNMAPFVETEWGGDAYDIMKRVKALVDPDGLLNPGVIINPNPRAHLTDLKSLPVVEEEIDRCTECGFCELRCPSRDLTLTPRQRIAVRRAIAREPAAAGALARAFEYDGVDTCATFAPEYKDTVNDTRLALRSAALFSLAVYTLLPLGLIGSVGEETVGLFDYVGALRTLTGSEGLTDFFVIVICISFVISMNTATADGGRALYGIARDDMTIKQLYHLNRFHVPGRAMTLDMVVNILFVFFVGSILGILVASNIGYVLAHFFALTSFILLRRDRPNWPRPIRLPDYWVGIAGLLAAIVAVLTIFGVGWMQVALDGVVYGGTKEKLIGFAVLAVSILLFFFRRIVQDGERPHWREDTPTMPDTHEAAMIEQETHPA